MPHVSGEHFHDGGLVPGAVAEVGIERRFEISPSREQRRTKLLQIARRSASDGGPFRRKAARCLASRPESASGRVAVPS